MSSAEKKNILVIENQQNEFEHIFNFLKAYEAYNVYPTKKNDFQTFITFINNVHVALNQQYDVNYRKQALEYIKNIITEEHSPFDNKKPVDLILMDHILAGAHYCYTGIDLANHLNKDRKDNPIPIVFLSKTPQSDKEKLEGNPKGHESDKDSNSFDLLQQSDLMGYEQHYEKYYSGSCEWVHKGYFGDESLNEIYFNRYVISAIERIMPLSERNKLMEAVNHVLSKYSFASNENERKRKLTHIKDNISSGKSYSDGFKEYIFTIRQRYNEKSHYEQMNNNDIKIIEEQYKSLSQ